MRKSLSITIDDEGRDRGKTYLITEMAAMQTEKWAARALLALSKSGIDIPDDIGQAGIAGIAAYGLRALVGLRFEDAEPLLDQMMSCIQIKPDPKNPNIVRPLIDDDIEELATRLHLRAEVLKLHTNFSMPGSPTISTSATTRVAASGRMQTSLQQ